MYGRYDKLMARTKIEANHHRHDVGSRVWACVQGLVDENNKMQAKSTRLQYMKAGVWSVEALKRNSAVILTG